MALSQADFYAYSRATGAPIPEDPRERADMAPEVLAFRRNQLKSPEKQSPDPLSVGIGVGLALAGAGGLVFGVRRLLGGAKQSATAGVRQANLAEMAAAESPVRRVAAEPTPEPSKVVTPPNALAQLEEPEYVSPYRKGPTYRDVYPSRFEVPPVSPEALAARRQLAAEQTELVRQATPKTYQLELGGEVSPTLRQIRSSEFGPNISPVRRDFLGLAQEEAPSRPLVIAPKQLNVFSPRAYLEQTGAVAPIQDLTSVQQQTLPQVVDQKLNAVASSEDQMTGRIKQQLQRNEDLDLTRVELLEETSDSLNINPIQPDDSINEVTRQLPDGPPLDQAEHIRNLSSQELADIAKEEMISLRQELEVKGLRPGTQRFDRALAQAWTTKAIPGAAPGSTAFRQLQELGKVDVTLPSSIRRAVDVVEQLDEEEALPKKQLRSVLNIGPQAEISETAAGTAIRGVAPSLQEVLPKTEERQLYGLGDPLVRGVPLEMGQDIPGAARVTGAMPADIPEELMSKQEITYEILNRPPTPEVPGGSAGIGVYGIEPKYVPGAMSKVTGEYSKAASRKPSYVPGYLLKKEQTPFSEVSTEALGRALEKSGKSGTKAITSEIERREAVKRSITASEVLRRARIEGRDPQEFLRRQLGGNV